MGGFVVGALLGFGGNFVEQGNTQSVFYGLSALGLIVSSVLLAVEHSSAGNRLAAAGFGLLALGETRVLNPTDVPGSDASFASGVLLYVPGLLLIALSGWAPRWGSRRWSDSGRPLRRSFSGPSGRGSNRQHGSPRRDRIRALHGCGHRMDLHRAPFRKGRSGTK